MFVPNVAFAKQDLLDQLTAVYSTSTWAHAFLNTRVMKLKDDPTWRKEAQDLIDAAWSDYRDTWLTRLHPSLVAGMSQAVLDYDALFQPAAVHLKKMVEAAAKRDDGRFTDAERKAVHDVVAALRALAEKNRARLDDLSGQAETFVTRVGADRERIHKIATAAAKDAAVEDRKVREFEEKVRSLQLLVASHGQRASDSAMSGGMASAAILAAISYGLVATGGVLAPAGFVVAVLNMGYQAWKLTENTDVVVAELKDLEARINELGAEQQQALSLHATLATLQTLEGQGVGLSRHAPRVQELWAEAVSSLDDVLDLLDQPGMDVRRARPLLRVEEAAKAWGELAAFARDVQRSTFEVPAPVVISTKTAARAA